MLRGIAAGEDDAVALVDEVGVIRLERGWFERVPIDDLLSLVCLPAGEGFVQKLLA